MGERLLYFRGEPGSRAGRLRGKAKG